MWARSGACAPTKTFMSPVMSTGKGACAAASPLVQDSMSPASATQGTGNRDSDLGFPNRLNRLRYPRALEHITREARSLQWGLERPDHKDSPHQVRASQGCVLRRPCVVLRDDSLENDAGGVDIEENGLLHDPTRVNARIEDHSPVAEEVEERLEVLRTSVDEVGARAVGVALPGRVGREHARQHAVRIAPKGISCRDKDGTANAQPDPIGLASCGGARAAGLKGHVWTRQFGRADRLESLSR